MCVCLWQIIMFPFICFLEYPLHVFYTAKTRRGTEVVVTGSTRNRLVPLRAGHVGSNPTLSAKRSKENA
jgi:hypothetical protein